MSSRSRSSAARSLVRAAVPVLALAALVSGCSIGPQEEPDLVVRSAAPRTTPATTETAQVPLTVQVYLLRGDRLVRVSRTVPAASGLHPSLEGLFDSLTAAEVAAGLRTALPHSTVPVAQLVGPVADIAMPTGFDRLSVRDQTAAMSQLVFTVTSNTTATEVQLIQNGRDLAVPDGTGRLLSRPVNTSDYATWSPTPAS